MSPTPITPSAIQLTLQYISPPSQLVDPLPPFLLSKPLLQRHHFLGISPQDPHEYLCWPSSSSSSLNVVHLLESFPRSPDHDDLVSYPVRYTSDDEDTSAHVHVLPSGPDGLRLVFQWDDDNGWKFHDATLMPFPEKSNLSLLEALKSRSSLTPFSISVPPIDHDNYGFLVEPEDINEDDDDDYWNAYGQETGGSSPGLSSFPAKGADPLSEDAYWARYSSVHGTADSTRSSPRPIHRRDYPSFEERPTDSGSPHPLPVRIESEDLLQQPIPIPHSTILKPNLRAPWDPASPETLARMLADISPRRSPVMSSSGDDGDDMSDEVSPTFESSGSEVLPTPPLAGLGLTEDSDALLSSPGTGVVGDPALQEEDTSAPAADYALRDTIRGLYALWKASRGKSESNREAFMQLVSDVIE